MAPMVMIVPLVISFVISGLLTPLVIGMAVRWKVGDKPSGRTSREIAHIGGIAIIGAIVFALLPVFIFLLNGDAANRVFLPVLVASGFLTLLLGVIDDLKSLHYLYKLFLQLAVSVAVSAGGLALIGHFGLLRIPVPAAAAAFFAVTAWVLAVTTSFNLIDGIDGLASSVALIAAASFGVAGWILGQPLVVALTAAVFGSTLAFLRYNFPPARIFMGDSGSLFLGLMFALIALLLLLPASDMWMRSAGAVIVLGVPLLDTTLAFLRRVLTGRQPFEADHMHMHHILLHRYGSVRRVDFVLSLFAAVSGALGVWTMLGSRGALATAAALYAAVFAVALRRMLRFDIPQERIDRIATDCGAPGGVTRRCSTGN